MPNIKLLSNTKSQIANIHQHLLDFQHLLTHEQIRKTNHFLAENALPFCELIDKCVQKPSSRHAQNNIEKYILSKSYSTLQNDLAEIKEFFRTILNNINAYRSWYPHDKSKVYALCPSCETEADWRNDWPINTQRHEAGVTALLNAIDECADSLNYLTHTYIQATWDGAFKGAITTTVNRITETVVDAFPASKKLRDVIKGIGTLVTIKGLSNYPLESIVASGVHLTTQHTMHKLGFNQRTSRQAATVAAITSTCAIELYNDPCPEKMIALCMNAAGAATAVVSVDSIFDGAQNLIQYGYDKFRTKPKKTRISSTQYAINEAIQFLGYDPSLKTLSRQRNGA